MRNQELRRLGGEMQIRTAELTVQFCSILSLHDVKTADFMNP